MASCEPGRRRTWTNWEERARTLLAEFRAAAGERLGATHAAELESVRARAEIDLARAEAKAQGAGELAEARGAEVTRLLAQVEDLRADAGRARDETRRLQAQLDRRSTLPGEPPATPAGTTRRNRPRSD